MKRKTIWKWKRLAACLLFINLLSAGLAGPAIAPEKNDALRQNRMGIGDKAEQASPSGLLGTPSNTSMPSEPSSNTVIPSGPPAPSSNTVMTIGPGSRLFDGGTITMLADPKNRQNLSLLIQAGDGTLAVVDGGWKDDNGHLAAAIERRGGHVSAWFLTHPHSDHAGALISILNDTDSRIAIDRIYYSLADQTWYDSKDSERAPFVEQLRDALNSLPEKRLHSDIQKGQIIDLGPIRVLVMNSPYLLDETSFNNSSVVYKFFLNNVSLLVLGDLGPEGGRILLNDYPSGELESDIVQMAHHGQYGVDRDVYAAINPKIALWPCPPWLWNNDRGYGEGSGEWMTLETRRWMEELGVRINYSTKDGDQIIY